MKFIIFLIFLIVSINGACTRTYYTYCCNDIEMLEQCEHVQSLINDYSKGIIQINQTYELTNMIPQLECDQYVVCCSDGGGYMCQNMNSYQKCTSATLLLHNFITSAQKYVTIQPEYIINVPIFTCKTKKNVDNYSVFNYYENNSSKISSNQLFGLIIFFVLMVIF